MAEYRPRFDAMCTGPSESKAAEHADRARYHDMMARFYRLERHDQQTFMRLFDALVDSNE